MKKSVDIATDMTKQLIALSTAIISLCVAFTDKILSSHAAQSHAILLFVSLICFVLSIIAGISVLMGLSGQLGRPKAHSDKPEEQSVIYENNVRYSSLAQLLFFVSALIVAMVYVGKASLSKEDKQDALGDSDKLLKVIRVSDYSIEKCQVTDTLFVDPKKIE